MIYMYMVLGCWLPFVLPQFPALETVWLWLMVGTIAIYVLLTIGVGMRWVGAESVGDDAKLLHTRIWLPSLGAILTGHPVIGILFALSAYSLGVIAKDAKKKLAK